MPRPFRPALEVLEARRVLACNVNFTDLDLDGLLEIRIVGDVKNQIIEITDAPTTDTLTLRLDCNGDGDTADRQDLNKVFDEDAPVEVITADLREGKDSMTYNVATGAMFQNKQREFEWDLGTGNDRVVANLQGQIDNGPTFDWLMKVFLDTGNDTFTANFNRASYEVKQGRAHIEVDGGIGNDVLRMASTGATGSAAIRAAGNLELALLGNVGNDDIDIDFSGTDALHLGAPPAPPPAPAFRGLIGGATLQVLVDTGAGHDSITLNLQNTATSTGQYVIDLLGAGGKDRIDYGVFTNSGTITFESTLLPAGTAKGLIDGGASTDTCTALANQTGVFEVQNCET